MRGAGCGGANVRGAMVRSLSGVLSVVARGAVLVGALVPAVQGLHAQAGGGIAGTVTVSAGAKTLPAIRVTIDQKVCGQELPDEAVVTDAQGHLANAVVILTGLKARASAPDPLVVNEKCHFTPRVQLVRPNGLVKTTSKDPMLHTTNAQNEKGTTLFNVAIPFSGMTIAKPIGGAGIVRLSCNIHPWMRAWMVVTDDTAAVTGADGRFSLTNVPPGTYELRVWHETYKSASQKVSVVAGKTTEIAVQMK